ncbi:heavy metal translocating P-type ATPase [Rhodobium gokarnense]|uniref:P-type Zn(2+) transporter n=1 Tax=Rhodobium gokarnense TaxID=364296 RepID=A0ABT3H9C6_9HYPH|nr:heavy metal translocating P-type ATPase [Rhodobium gokarnense]MCW2306964.1 heavy metal translocating P-type ATPase [Rhodobium gokarnense]
MNAVSPPPATATNGLRLVHETPRRLRFKLPLLRDRRVNFGFLQVMLESEDGVASVRINDRAASLVIAYDGRSEVRDALLRRLKALSGETLPKTASGRASEVADLAPLIANGALIALLPFLGPTAKAALTFLNISGTLVNGAAAATRGIKVETLDALAIGLTAAKGEYLTANTTEFLLKLAGYVESTTAQKSDDMLRHLLRPEPVDAWVEKGGKLTRVADTDIRENDRVVVGVGERIPVDGLVLRGNAFVNQASITGESEPVRKEPMDRVISGSVVEDGRLTIEARHVGEETTTARVSKFIEQALDQTSETQRVSAALADKRVYLTLGTGAAVYSLTRDLTRLESVLLVDYSCAIKLGTPLAFKSGMYNAATSGLLIKGGQTIEQLAAVDAFVFDKTGTLTHSELDVVDVLVFDTKHWTPKRLLAMTASIEEHAHHPVAEAIVRRANEDKFNHIDHGEVDYLVAHGMRCKVRGAGDIQIGSRHFLEDHENISFAPYDETIERLSKEGKTLLYVAADGAPLGVIGLEDRVRANAAREVSKLRDLGIRRIVMLTGDNEVKAAALAKELGITEVHAGMEPEGKAGVIEALQGEGHKVAFVGDGVNDGPALVTADVGIAMPRGAEIARASADVVLLEDRLELLAASIDISRQTMKLVDTNFKLAAGINTGILAGALAGFLSPITTAVLHNGTTVGLLLKALKGAKPQLAPPAKQTLDLKAEKN